MSAIQRQLPAAELFVARIEEVDRDQWLANAGHWLVDEERTRACAISDPHARTLHVVGRALTRLIASDRRGGDPCGFAIAQTDQGKPFLRDHPDLWFNVAHTGDVVVVAVSEDAPVGVDVERLPESSRPEPAIRRCAPAEADYLLGLPAERRKQEFLSFWTIKEAVGKALGQSVFAALGGVVLATPPDTAHRLSSVWMGPPPEQWTLHEQTVTGGREHLAVAVAAPGATLSEARQLLATEIATKSGAVSASAATRT